MWANLRRPFLWSIIGVIYLAYINPALGIKGGILKPEITVKYLAVFFIFFISGISLETKEIAAAACQYRLHIFIQVFSLLFTPLMVQLFLQLLEEVFFDRELLTGFITVSCMPPPVSSAVILTRAVGGNEAAAVFNSAFGSFLGIFVTPALLFTFLGFESSVPMMGALVQISSTVILPVILGQLSRNFLRGKIHRYKKPLSSFSSAMLLLIIYATFCDTFAQNNSAFTTSTICLTAFLVIFLQSFLMGLVFIVMSKLSHIFSPEDTVAAVFCATHKSLTLGNDFMLPCLAKGFPLLKILYENDPKFFLISFPLLVYHPSQILYGSLLISILKEWMSKKKRIKKMYSV